MMENGLKRQPKQSLNDLYYILFGLVAGKRLKCQDNLPLEIVYDILIRLSVKTLSMLRCVSKPWCSVISNPRFLKDHSSLAQRHPNFLVVDGSDAFVRFTTFSSEGFRLRDFCSNKITSKTLSGFENFRFKIIESCLGLVCLKNHFNWWIIICNPSTEEIIMLPERPRSLFELCIGFGYAASTEQFKVIRFYSVTPYGEQSHCEIFDLGTSCGWREARSPPYMPLHDAYLPFLHGAIHLMPNEHTQSEEDQYIAAFDVDTEEYRKITLPDVYFREALLSDLHQLASLRGSLHLVLDYIETNKTLELWLLKDYHGGNWVKQCTIDLSWAPSYYHASPLEIMGDGFVLLNVHMDNKKELCLYDTRKHRFVGKIGVNCEATFYSQSFLALGSRS